MSWVENHPYKVYVDGLLQGHFSNLRCAAIRLHFHDFNGRHFVALTEAERLRRWVECGKLTVAYKECMEMI